MLTKTKRLASLAAFIAASIMMMNAQAQTEPTAEKPESTKEQSTAKQPEKKSGERKNTRPDEVFIPTEEISEDSPVPFPVDI